MGSNPTPSANFLVAGRPFRLNTYRERPIHMNLKNEFNRLTGLFDHGKDRWHSMADDLRGEASCLGRRAQRGFMQSRDRLGSIEEMATRTMRERPQFFILAGLCLLALIIAKVVMDQNDRQSWD